MYLKKKEIIKNYLLGDNLDIEVKLERFEIAWDIWENLEDIKKDMRKKVIETLLNKIECSEDFKEYEIKDHGLLQGLKWAPLRIYKRNWIISELQEIPLSYSIEADKNNYFNIFLGIIKWNDKTPFKGSWQNNTTLDKSMRNLLSRIFEELKHTSSRWKVSDWYIAYKPFESYLFDNWKKEFYLDIIKKGYEYIANCYFREILTMKEKTEKLIDNFIEEYKQKFL